MKENDTIKTNKMTLARFGSWLQEQCEALLCELPNRTECVISIEHIEPGCFAALFAVPADDGLLIFELCDYFPDTAAACQALGNHAETYPPLFFEEWAAQQYLTDHGATVEIIEL